MSMEEVQYYGFGVDLGRLNENVAGLHGAYSNNAKKDKLAQKVFTCLNNNIDTCNDHLISGKDDDDVSDVDLHTAVNTCEFISLAIIENNHYRVGYDATLPVRTYTVKEAKQHLINYFDELVDTFGKLLADKNKDLQFGANNKYKVTVSDFNKVKADILWKGKNYIDACAMFDYEAGPWTDEV